MSFDAVKVSLGSAIVATASPGCMLQLAAGVRPYGSGQRVLHVVEVPDESYRNFSPARAS